MNGTVPCIVDEDDDILVINKPPGINTHSPSPYHGEGIYEWLRNREPRWRSLAIIHRLDKETSGLIVFGKTPLANSSLTRQFTDRSVRKEYTLVTDRPVAKDRMTSRTSLVRAGARYLSRPVSREGEIAETDFQVLSREGSKTVLAAFPRTGRTHQIRVHASELGFPILGDDLYGGTPAKRVHLHAGKLGLEHPATGVQIDFEVPARFDLDPRRLVREAFIDPHESTAYRLIHGGAEGFPGFYLDRLGDFLLAQSEFAPSAAEMEILKSYCASENLKGAYHKVLRRQIGGDVKGMSPALVFGNEAPGEFFALENGLDYSLSFREGYSFGLFLDQRENRRRILHNHIAPDFPLVASAAVAMPEILNTFAYTCGFSVCAAKAGARTTSIDLSEKYLAWGKRNFQRNDLNPADHDFIFGDIFEWLRRLARKERLFEAILLDPPTFSKTKEGKTFQAEKDLARLILAALPLLKKEGVLFVSTNATRLSSEDFVQQVVETVGSTRREIMRQHFVPQPIDFPITRSEPGYLKTIWVKVR